MVYKRTFFLLAFSSAVLLLVPLFASAAGIPDKIVPCDGLNCNMCHIATLAQNVLNTGIFVAVFLSAILFAWAGWKYVTAGGGGEVSTAKGIFFNVLIGLVIILAAWLIVDTIMRTLVNENASIGPWNKIC
jgi:multisubunit Na+/H+ antiporter MnhF subunit